MTNTYKKPLVLANEELAEGVYAASGSVAGDCWTLSYTEPQKWNGQAHIYEIKAVHTKAVAHMSESLKVEAVFDKTVTNAWCENSYSETVEGVGSNTLIVTRNHHANGEYNGDVVTFKLFVVAGNQASSEALVLKSLSFISCGKTTTPNYDFID